MPSVVGLDASYAQCRRAMVTGDIVPVQADLNDPLPVSQRFTHVFTHATLHWVSNWPSLLREVRRALCKDGEFLGSVSGEQNLRELLARLCEFSAFLGIAPPSPSWQLTSVRGFHRLLSKAGFRVLSVTERFVEPSRELVSPRSLVAAMGPLLFGTGGGEEAALQGCLNELGGVPIRYHQIVFKARVAA